MDLLLAKIAYATNSELNEFIGKVDEQIINPLISFLFALAIGYFLYGVFEFFSNQINEEKKTTGKTHMLWGIIGITIMLGVFTILSIILNTLDIPKSEINPEDGTVNLSP